jgi:hypothetical protein
MTWLRRHRAIVLLSVLLLLGAAVATLLAGPAGNPAAPPLSSDDAAPEGALALAWWLQRLGHPVVRVEGSQSTPEKSVGLFFELAPTERVSPTDSEAILAWVRAGGTLVYVPGFVPSLTGDGLQSDDGLAPALGLQLLVPVAPATAQAPTHPLIGSPALPFFTQPAATSFSLAPTAGLDLTAPDWAPLVVGPGNRVVVAVRALSRGRVYAAASADFFANAQIGQGNHAALLLNLLARQPPGEVVAFDEYHHGVIDDSDLLSTLRAAPWGWALGYLALGTFLFLAWGGRRFGPAVVPEVPPGRSGADYVASVAGLMQQHRGGGRPPSDWAQAHYRRLVRRRLARTHGLRPDVPASALAQQLAIRRPLAADRFAADLEALAGPGLGERGLLDRVRSIEMALQGPDRPGRPTQGREGGDGATRNLATAAPGGRTGAGGDG